MLARLRLSLAIVPVTVPIDRPAARALSSRVSVYFVWRWTYQHVLTIPPTHRHLLEVMSYSLLTQNIPALRLRPHRRPLYLVVGIVCRSNTSRSKPAFTDQHSQHGSRFGHGPRALRCCSASKIRRHDCIGSALFQRVFTLPLDRSPSRHAIMPFLSLVQMNRFFLYSDYYIPLV